MNKSNPLILTKDSFKNAIVVEDSGVYVPEDRIAKGDDALNLLELLETRNFLLNDLSRVSWKKFCSFISIRILGHFYIFKLDTFLKQKHTEMKSESDNLIITTILQDAPKNIQAITEKGNCITLLIIFITVNKLT